MNKPATLYTIERRSTPLSSKRYLAVLNTGHVGWVEPDCPVAIFEDEDCANHFRRYRMRGHAADAVVVRHAIH